MKCQKCQFENPDGMKFCGDCGAKIEKPCPKCNFSNPPQFKFCGECGHDLTLTSEPAPAPKDLSFDEKLDKIQRYLPKGLTEKILAQRGRIEGERKQVTVMFCDMEGFTSMSESLGPEEAYDVMDQVWGVKPNRVLGGMNIHIHLIMGEAYEQRYQGKLPFHQAPCIGFHDSMVEHLVADKASIDVNV